MHRDLDLHMKRGRKVPGGNLRYRPPVKTELASYPLWWFHPDRPETHSRKPDPIFLRKLEEDFPGIAINWHPIKQRWQVWARSNAVQTPYCRGWKLLFFLEDANGGYVPLDDRTLVTIWLRSGKKHGDGLKYYDRLVAEELHQRKMKDKAMDQERDDKSSDYWGYTQIKNIGKGSKFVNHHAGD